MLLWCTENNLLLDVNKPTEEDTLSVELWRNSFVIDITHLYPGKESLA